MDVTELAALVRNLVLDNDEVSLPGVGVFVAEEMPAAIVDKGYTVNPPYRSLSFRQKLGSDTLLVDAYVEKRDDRDAARSEILTYLQDLKTILKVKKTVFLPGLGRLRATRENIFFFIPDENMDIYPEGFGLGPVSMKMSRVEDVPQEAPVIVEEVAAEPVAGPAEPAEPVVTAEEPAEPVAEPAAETPAAPAATAAPAPAATSAPAPAVRRLPESLKIIIIILIAAVALLALFALLGRVAPDFVDLFLYSPEERAILNY